MDVCLSECPFVEFCFQFKGSLYNYFLPFFKTTSDYPPVSDLFAQFHMLDSENILVFKYEHDFFSVQRLNRFFRDRKEFLPCCLVFDDSLDIHVRLEKPLIVFDFDSDFYRPQFFVYSVADISNFRFKFFIRIERRQDNYLAVLVYERQIFFVGIQKGPQCPEVGDGEQDFVGFDMLSDDDISEGDRSV